MTPQIPHSWDESLAVTENLAADGQASNQYCPDTCPTCGKPIMWEREASRWTWEDDRGDWIPQWDPWTATCLSCRNDFLDLNHDGLIRVFPIPPGILAE